MAHDATVEEVVAKEQGPRTGEQIQQAFEAWERSNPCMLLSIIGHAKLLASEGCPRISTKYLLEWARYETHEHAEHHDEYVINNDFSAPLARYLVAMEPSLAPLIDVRRSKVDEVGA